MTFKVELKSNARQLSKQLGELARRQLPFATAAALTDTALDARDRLRGTLDRYFTVRAKARMQRGISIQRAEKRHWPRPFALVGSRDEFMVPHVTGGTKRPQRGAKTVTIPAKWIKRTATGRIPKSIKPRQLREKKGTVVTDEEIKRRPPGARAKARTRGLQVVYLRRRSVKIDDRWPFESLVRLATRTHYPVHFEAQLRDAVATAKRRAPAPPPR